jgi:hypothetical protein
MIEVTAGGRCWHHGAIDQLSILADAGNIGHGNSTKDPEM